MWPATELSFQIMLLVFQLKVHELLFYESMKAANQYSLVMLVFILACQCTAAKQISRTEDGIYGLGRNHRFHSLVLAL